MEALGRQTESGGTGAVDLRVAVADLVWRTYRVGPRVADLVIGVNLPKNLRGTRTGLSPSNESKFLKVVNTPPSP